MRSIVLLFALSIPAHADTLVLRSGTRVAGRWWAADGDVISFLVNNRLARYSRSEVAEIVFGVESPASPAVVPAVPAPAAPVPNTPKPERIGVVYFQDGSNRLLPLEQTVAVGHGLPAGRGAGASEYWDMAGAQSPFRLPGDARLLFVVDLPDGIPPGAYSLYPLETSGNARRTKAARDSAITVPPTVTKVAGTTYTLVPVSNLAPGEYAFTPSGSNAAYCFAIRR